VDRNLQHQMTRQCCGLSTRWVVSMCNAVHCARLRSCGMVWQCFPENLQTWHLVLAKPGLSEASDTNRQHWTHSRHCQS
jgi:hypothetical protein